MLALLPSTGEMLVLLVFGLLLFGKRLPQVLRDAVRTVADLKRSLQRFKEQMHEDAEFRDLSRAADDLREAVHAPRRLLTDKLREVTDSVEREGEALAREVQAPPPDEEALQRLTDETRATPGPEASIVPPPAEKSVFEQEAERLRAQPG